MNALVYFHDPHIARITFPGGYSFFDASCFFFFPTGTDMKRAEVLPRSNVTGIDFSFDLDSLMLMYVGGIFR